MTDTPAAPPPNGAAPTPASAANMRILAQFTRDLSFENPLAPDSLRATSQPEIDLGVEMNARGRPDSLFEVDLKLSVTANRDSKTVFQVELLYGALFEIGGVPEEHIEGVLLVECPRYMFPFARRIIADAITEGGFPPFLLEPIDFASVYSTQRAQREQLNQQPLGTA